MSQWTHITATISVDTFITLTHRVEVLRKAQKVVNESPKITGSEGNACVTCYVQDGHDHSLITKDGWDRFQSCITITIQGDLRDRDKREVKKEFIDFVNYIEHNFHILDGSYGLVDEWTGNEAGIVNDLIIEEEEK